MKRRGLLAGAACLALAAASLLIPSAPTTDPWGWIVWGREVSHLELSTTIGGAPSWKPLPVLLTAPLSLLGGNAPDLWLLLARAAGLLGLLAAFRLGSRVAGRGAGVVAAVGVLLSVHWVRCFLHGYTEPLAIALLLMAVDRHWSGRSRQALLLGAAVSLARPETLPLVLLYGVVMCRRRELGLWPLVTVALAVPALWIVPDWIGSGDPFHAGKVSSSLQPGGLHAALGAVVGGAGITPIPLSLGAIAGLALAWRIGDRRVVELSGVALGWTGLLVVLMVAGYPASARFFVLPAALICVLGAAGAVRGLELVLSGTSRIRVAAVVAIAALPVLALRTAASGAEAQDSIRRAHLEDALASAIARVGAARLQACGVPVLPRGLGWMRGDVAWRLGLPLEAVRSVPTTGDGYLHDLSRFGTGSTPDEVTVSTRRRNFVLLVPFGRTHLRVTSPGLDLDTAGRSGTWQVLLPDSRACAPTRAA